MAEVKSPVSRPGSKVGSGQPKNPGAFSNPSRGSGQQTDNTLPQSHGGTSRQSDFPAASLGVTGPED